MCCNHKSLSDPIFLAMFVRKKIFFMAKSELFEHHGKCFAALIRSLGAFSVRRDTADKASIKGAEELLVSDCIVGIFPQGKIVRDCKELKIESGAAMLSVLTGVPIVPAAIVYSGNLHPFKRITVKFGIPIEPPAENKQNTELYRKTTAVLRSKMEELLFNIQNNDMK